MVSLVEQIQADALDRTVPVTDLLRKAKVVAIKLDLPDLLAWSEAELTAIKTKKFLSRNIGKLRAVLGHIMRFVVNGRPCCSGATDRHFQPSGR